MNPFHRLVSAVAMSWLFSVTLALVFASITSGRFSLNTLALPGVVSVALFVGSLVALVMTPVAIWSVRTGRRNLLQYGPVLWLSLAAYIVLVIPRTGEYGPVGLALLAILGAVSLGFIPKAD